MTPLEWNAKAVAFVATEIAKVSPIEILYMTEIYYAVRIGSPKKHVPYFMMRENETTPWLFNTKAQAEAHCPKQPSTKVMRVKVQTTTK